MRNIILLAVLICGLTAGYFVGSFRGRDAIEALKKEKETMATLEKERASIEANLKKDIASLEQKRNSEMSKAREEFDANSAKWEKSKANLDATIKKQNAMLVSTNRDIDALSGKLSTATGADKAKLEADIARLRQQAQDIQVEADGTRCLQTKAPHDVIEALGNQGAGKK